MCGWAAQLESDLRQNRPDLLTSFVSRRQGVTRNLIIWAIMGTKKILMAAAALWLVASPAFSNEGKMPVKSDRRPIVVLTKTAIQKNLREAKRSQRLSVIPTDIRQKRFLTVGVDLDRQQNGVLSRL